MPIIAKALNHKSQDSTAIYARLNNEPVLEAVNSAVKLMIEIRACRQLAQNCVLAIEKLA
jgi:hypothetical protein